MTEATVHSKHKFRGFAAYAAICGIIAMVIWTQAFGVIQRNEIIQNSGDAVDFVRLYAVGNIALSSPHRGDIYSVDRLTEVQAKICAPQKVDAWAKFNYPPFLLTFLAPLATLTLQEAWLAWSAAAIFLTLGALWIADGEETTSKRFFVVFLATCATFASWYNLRVGQTAAFVLLGLSLPLYYLRKNRPYAAGVSTAVVLLKPQYAPLIIVSGLALGKWKFFKGMALTSILLLVLSLIEIGFEGLVVFVLSFVRADLNHGLLKPEAMENFRSLLMLFFGVPMKASFLISATVFGIAAIFLVLLWHKIYPRLKEIDKGAFDLCAAITVLMSLVFSLHTYAYDYIALALPLLYIWRWLETANLSQKSKQILKAILLLLPLFSWSSFLALPLLTALREGGTVVLLLGWTFWYMLFRSLFVYSLLMLGFLLNRVEREFKAVTAIEATHAVQA